MMPVADHLQMERAGDIIECGSSFPATDDMNNYMAWGWVLESLLDVKKLSLPFFADIIEYIQPHIEHPQCSTLLQKVALRYLDEEVTAFHRKFDLCDVSFLRFILKEQGVSNLRSRIHSLKESTENDLTLRVETEAVLTNLRCNGKEGSGADWAAFEDALDHVFSEDMLEPRGRERRKELIAVLQDRPKGEPEKHICKELLGKYPLEALCSDLARFVDDKRKLFKIKFLDQVAKDVENGVYSVSQASESLEPRGGTTFPGSTPVPSQNDDHIASQEEGDSVAAVARVSYAKDVGAEVEQIRKGLSNVMKEILNDVTKLTEDVHPTASMPVLSPDLSNQPVFNLAAPVAGNLFSMQQNCAVICPVKRAEAHLEIVESVEYQRENTTPVDYGRIQSFKGCGERDMQQTALISSDTVPKRRGSEILDQITAVARKRKFNDVEELSEEQRTQSGATEEAVGCLVGPIMQNSFGEVPSKDRLSSEDMDIVVTRVPENCNVIDNQVGNMFSSRHGQMSQNEAGPTPGASNQPVAGGNGELNAKCCFCGSSDGCQISCHRCLVLIHEGCLSKLCSSQVEVENCWYCFGCAATMAQEGEKEAEETLRKAKEAVLTTQKQLATFFSARRESSREHHEGLNVVFEFSQGNQCERVLETLDESIISPHAKRDSTVDSRDNPEVEDKAVSSKSGIFTETGFYVSGSTLPDVMGQDTIKQRCRTTQDTKMPTAPRASVVIEEVNAVFGNHGPGKDLPREIIGGRGPTSVPFLPVSQGLPPGDQHVFGYCGQEQSEGSRSLADRVARTISDANDCHNESGPNGMFNEDVETTNVATNGSEVPVHHAGYSSPSRGLLFNTRNPEGDGDGHDGDLEEVCEGNRAAGDKINVAEQAAVVSSEKISAAANVQEKLRPRKVYSGRGQVPGVRRKNLPWTAIEEDVLKEGVNMFSTDGQWGFQWKRILEFGAGKFHESRTTVDLKDKWRNLRLKQV